MTFLENTCYIVCYRESGDERKFALQFTLNRVRQYFPEIEILVVEQDVKPKLILDERLDAKHLFIFNSGLFNRSWSFNCGVKQTSREILVFADADVFLDKEGYLDCFNAITNFDAITPNKTSISNVAIDIENNNDIQFLNERKLHSFAGGILVMTREAFEKSGGWDERFEGWGGEDDAISHVIFNRLRSKSFNLPNYHIDQSYEFVLGNNHPRYEINKDLLSEILTRNGIALDRYVDQLHKMQFGNPDKYKNSTSELLEAPPLKFVLAITTFNRINYLKSCIETFLQTRSNDNISWELIIADDGSTDGTLEYLSQVEKEHGATIIRNKGIHIHHQVNSIIKDLSRRSFDLCFRCDDDVFFLQKGWDNLYWEATQRTGYEHLIFYDKQWQAYSNLSQTLRFGHLVSDCTPENLQGAFYTISKDIIEKVGYLDTQQFGASGLGHVDYSLRCCRAGFNVLAHPFDIENSNSLLQLQSISSYKSSESQQQRAMSNKNRTLALKQGLLKADRIYIPYNENFPSNNLNTTDSKLANVKFLKRQSYKNYKKADPIFYPERGVSGILGFLLKRLYNLSIDFKLYFIPKGIKACGRILNKISIDLINLEK